MSRVDQWGNISKWISGVCEVGISEGFWWMCKTPLASLIVVVLGVVGGLVSEFVRLLKADISSLLRMSV